MVKPGRKVSAGYGFVPRLGSVSAGAAVPDTRKRISIDIPGAIVMAAPDVDREPDTSVIMMVLRGPIEFATKLVVPLGYE